jgi:ribosomal protein L11 methyltransferase
VPFTAFTFELGGRDPEVVGALCTAAGAIAVTFTDLRDDAVLEPSPGEVRLWPATRVQALFTADTPVSPTRAALAGALALGHVEVEAVPDRTWEREWLRDFRAMRFGRRLWVCPHHDTVTDPDAIVVQLDPGLAFGTGTHATTALCLEWLDAHLEKTATIIDYGCGSGVLAIAAARLGARDACCYDLDPQALIAARDNARANDVEDRVRVVASPDALPSQVDVLVANILASTLCELAPLFAQLVRPGGHAVLAGILAEQAGDVTRAHDAWFDTAPFGQRDGWVCLDAHRKAHARARTP